MCVNSLIRSYRLNGEDRKSILSADRLNGEDRKSILSAVSGLTSPDSDQ